MPRFLTVETPPTGESIPRRHLRTRAHGHPSPPWYDRSNGEVAVETIMGLAIPVLTVAGLFWAGYHLLRAIAEWVA